MDILQRILCVEDDPDIRLVLHFSLARVGGYELLMCPTGGSAVAQAADFAPQLVLLDVMLPDLTGPETLHALRRIPALREVPVIFLTAKAMQHEVDELLRQGVSGLILKPFDAMRLPHVVRSYWENDRVPAAA